MGFNSDTESAPAALLYSLKHYLVLHERNANDASRYLQLPTDRVVEPGKQFSI